MAAKLMAWRPEPQKRLIDAPVTRRPVGGEHGVAGDVGALLADLGDAADDHVVDGRRDAAALGEAVEGLRQQLLGVDVRERALAGLALAARRPDRVEDVGFGHGWLQWWMRKLMGPKDRFPVTGRR